MITTVDSAKEALKAEKVMVEKSINSSFSWFVPYPASDLPKEVLNDGDSKQEHGVHLTDKQLIEFSNEMKTDEKMCDGGTGVMAEGGGGFASFFKKAKEKGKELGKVALEKGKEYGKQALEKGKEYGKKIGKSADEQVKAAQAKAERFVKEKRHKWVLNYMGEYMKENKETMPADDLKTVAEAKRIMGGSGLMPVRVEAVPAFERSARQMGDGGADKSRMERKIIISYRWWRTDGLTQPIHPKHQEALEESAMERIQDMMGKGYTSGELRDTVRMFDSDGDEGIPYMGWWEVNKEAKACDGGSMGDGGAGLKFHAVADLNKGTLTLTSGDYSNEFNLVGERSDFWHGFEMNGKEYDINFYIDEDNKASATVYPVDERKMTVTSIYTSIEYPVSLQVIGDVGEYMRIGNIACDGGSMKHGGSGLLSLNRGYFIDEIEAHGYRWSRIDDYTILVNGHEWSIINFLDERFYYKHD